MAALQAICCLQLGRRKHHLCSRQGAGFAPAACTILLLRPGEHACHPAVAAFSVPLADKDAARGGPAACGCLHSKQCCCYWLCLLGEHDAFSAGSSHRIGVCHLHRPVRTGHAAPGSAAMKERAMTRHQTDWPVVVAAMRRASLLPWQCRRPRAPRPTALPMGVRQGRIVPVLRRKWTEAGRAHAACHPSYLGCDLPIGPRWKRKQAMALPAPGHAGRRASIDPLQVGAALRNVLPRCCRALCIAYMFGRHRLLSAAALRLMITPWAPGMDARQ